MSEIDAKIDALVPDWMNLPDIAERWGVGITKVRDMINDGTLLSVRRGENKVLMVPAAFVGDDGPVKGVIGTLTVLKDSGFSKEEALEWLFTDDPSLPGTPAQALNENRGTEVRRRAQAMSL
ncbi:hypothetical protein ABH931_004487 [Streptacidiphilus sp. MAP12-33]|uniref:Rv2175c family DNA-binding protein n=1 Tax=Streptacidiphilus sp. MAP12-33 TaxID=3156266 RepID=UPI0035127D4B